MHGASEGTATGRFPKLEELGGRNKTAGWGRGTHSSADMMSLVFMMVLC